MTIENRGSGRRKSPNWDPGAKSIPEAETLLLNVAFSYCKPFQMQFAAHLTTAADARSVCDSYVFVAFVSLFFPFFCFKIFLYFKSALALAVLHIHLQKYNKCIFVQATCYDGFTFLVACHVVQCVILITFLSACYW